MKRILLDQGLPRSALKSLKKAGWDALHTGDIGLHMAADKEIIEYARHEDRVIITLDSDFHSILAVENAKNPSVIRIRREGIKGEMLAEIIIRIWDQIEVQLKSGAMVTVSQNAIRIRKIPIY